VEFRILGPLEVVEAGQSLPLGGTRQRAVLALLLTHANQVVSTDRLVDELWGERPPKAALNTVQFYVSRLRKTLAPHEVIATRAPGYLMRIEPEQLDLHRSERLGEEGSQALAEGHVEVAAGTLRAALALWRGPPLADLASEPFAQIEVARLEELRVAMLEQRIEADLALGRHADLVGELEALVAEYPLRERLRAQLMLALYRSGRQGEALEVYQKTRQALVDELAIEPSRALKELETSILRQEPSLSAGARVAGPSRSIVVAVQDDSRLDLLLALAEPLAMRPRELILCSLVSGEGDPAAATAAVHERRDTLIARGVAARAAAFTSAAPGYDVVRLSSKQGVEFLLLEVPPAVLEEGGRGPDLDVVLAGAPCDVALLVTDGSEVIAPGPDRPVLVPFGGADHDWSAIEIAAWIARAHGAALKLVGSTGEVGSPDASRLLATASLLVQRATGIPAEPQLARRGHKELVAAAEGAGLLLTGLSERWRDEGLGEIRLALARRVGSALFVRRGLRPGGLAPDESVTRFTWSLRPTGSAR
jgi:DNA-binding SARP family transcriptional activator